MELEGDGGTHSILDTTSLSPNPKRKTISPFPNSLLLDYFSSGQPTPDEVPAVYEFVSSAKFLNQRWRGIYRVAHFEGVPSDIFFTGSSGD